MKKRKIVNTGSLKSELLSIIGKYKRMPEVRWLRTGLHALDLAIGNGIPLGRIVEIYGNESSGKSLLAWTVAKAFQNVGGIVILFDVEATAPREFMEQVGVNHELFILGDGKTVEEIKAEIIEKVNEIRGVDKECPILIIWDSIAATTSDGEWEDKGALIPKSNMGSRAKAMSEFFRQLTIWLTEQNVTLFCINQVREKIGIVYGNKEESPGGRGLKFHASLRIQINRGKQLKDDGVYQGQKAALTIFKNKVGPQFRKAEIDIRPEVGYDVWTGLVDMLIAAKRVESINGGYFKYHDKKYDDKEIAKACEENPELLKEWIYGSGIPSSGDNI